MKYCIVILLFLLSSCIIIPTPPHREEGRTFIHPNMVSFIHTDTTTREEVLMKLGEPDAVALHEQVFVYEWQVTKAWVGTIGNGPAGNIYERQFFLVGFNDSNTVIKHEIFKRNIDKNKKSIRQFLKEWYADAK